MARRGSCFVIMPFGHKDVGKVKVNFNKVFERYISDAGEQAGFIVERADTSGASGSITGNFLNKIFKADVVVVDATYPNANVFYELGVRHALSPFGTVVYQLVGGDLAVVGTPTGKRATIEPMELPFDVRDVTTIAVELSEKNLCDKVAELRDAILSASKRYKLTSPVFHHVREVRDSRPSRAAVGRQDDTFEVIGAEGRLIGYRSGDIADLSGELAMDYWVNSENTQMQMARTVEHSVSSTIRRLGARQPDPLRPGFDDTIAQALRKAMGDRHFVHIGEVLVTTSGKLAQTNGVKAVLHAATVTGRPGRDFEPGSPAALAECIRNVLHRARTLSSREPPGKRSRSLVMPMFGIGQAKNNPLENAERLVEAAVEALDGFGPRTKVNDLGLIAFCAYSQNEVDLLRRIFETLIENRIVRRIAEPAPMPRRAGATTKPPRARVKAPARRGNGRGARKAA